MNSEPGAMRRSSGPEPRNRAVTVKLSGSEKTAIEAAAARRQLSLSAYIAEVALAAAEGRTVQVHDTAPASPSLRSLSPRHPGRRAVHSAPV
jgi:hypothetical protein